MGTYDSIATGIITILNTVSLLKIVYDGERGALGKFPAACVSAGSHTDTFQSLNSNKRDFVFTVNFYFRTDDTNNPDYEQVLRKAVDAALIALEHDVTLGGVCDFSIPTTGKWGYGTKESPVRVCSVTVTARTHIVR